MSQRGSATDMATPSSFHTKILTNKFVSTKNNNYQNIQENMWSVHTNVWYFQQMMVPPWACTWPHHTVADCYSGVVNSRQGPTYHSLPGGSFLQGQVLTADCGHEREEASGSPLSIIRSLDLGLCLRSIAKNYLSARSKCWHTYPNVF